MNKIVEKLLFEKNNNLLENIALCLAVTLASAFVYYDRYNGFAGALRALLVAMIFIGWVVAGYSSGRKRKYGFLIFTGAYWLIPNLYMIFYSLRDNVRGYSKWLSLINKTADLLVCKPFGFIAEKTACSEYLYEIVLVVIAVSAYFIGRSLKTVMFGSASSDEAAE